MSNPVKNGESDVELNADPVVAKASLTFDEDDLLGRREFAEAMMAYVQRRSGPHVIELDAPWGFGKTVFVKKWSEMLRAGRFDVVYLDAFATDASDDPYVAIVGVLLTHLRNRRATESKAAALLSAASRVGKAIVPVAAGITLKALTLGVAGKSEIEAIATAHEDLAARAGDWVTETVAGRLKEQSELEGSVVKLRTALTAIAGSGPDSLPLVVIVDELDRCRPTYALRLLERVKHFFDAPGVVFVLVCHRLQLEAAVRHEYGAEVDSARYLAKFIDTRLSLPAKAGRDGFANDWRAMANEMCSKSTLAGDARCRDLADGFTAVASTMRLSFRDMQRVMGALELFYAFAQARRKTFGVPLVVAGLAALQVAAPRSFANVCDNGVSANELESAFPGLLQRIRVPGQEGDMMRRLMCFIMIPADLKFNGLDGDIQRMVAVANELQFKSTADVARFVARSLSQFGRGE